MICLILAMEILQGVWKQHLRLRAVVGYSVNFFLSQSSKLRHQITWMHGKTLNNNEHNQVF